MNCTLVGTPSDYGAKETSNIQYADGQIKLAKINFEVFFATFCLPIMHVFYSFVTFCFLFRFFLAWKLKYYPSASQVAFGEQDVLHTNAHNQ